jgi:hypothetical protein
MSARSSFGRIGSCTELITSEGSARSLAFGIQPEEFRSYRLIPPKILSMNPRFPVLSKRARQDSVV